MSSSMRLSQLRPGQRRLVRAMGQMGYGRIEGLIIQDGQPVFTPAPKIVREIKLDPEQCGRSDPLPEDYQLKHQVRHLLSRLAELGDGRVESLIVADGLPVRMTIESQSSILEKRPA